MCGLNTTMFLEIQIIIVPLLPYDKLITKYAAIITKPGMKEAQVGALRHKQTLGLVAFRSCVSFAKIICPRQKSKFFGSSLVPSGSVMDTFL